MNKMEIAGPVVQSSDLNLILFERQLHPELFRLYGDYSVTQGKYRASIWVVGLGHSVTVHYGNKAVSEVIVREMETIPTRGVIYRFKLKGERDLERKTPEGWTYMVSTQVELMDEPLYKSVHNDLIRHAAKRGFYHSYPQWADAELTPFTLIDHEARDAEFHLYAYHAFPAERTIVKTQSIFELPEDAARK
jgi:hypothetical protein